MSFITNNHVYTYPECNPLRSFLWWQFVVVVLHGMTPSLPLFVIVVCTRWRHHWHHTFWGWWRHQHWVVVSDSEYAFDTGTTTPPRIHCLAPARSWLPGCGSVQRDLRYGDAGWWWWWWGWSAGTGVQECEEASEVTTTNNNSSNNNNKVTVNWVESERERAVCNGVGWIFYQSDRRIMRFISWKGLKLIRGGVELP